MPDNDVLISLTARMNEASQHTVLALLEQAKIAVEARATLGSYQEYQRWISEDCHLSSWYGKRLLHVARIFQKHTPEQFKDPSAVLKLAAPSKAHVLDLALGRGEPVSAQDAQNAIDADNIKEEYLRDLFLAGEIAYKAAQAVAAALVRLDEPLANFCRITGIRDIGVIHTLETMIEEAPDEAADIITSGYIQDGDQSIPIGQASAIDIETYYRALRQEGHITDNQARYKDIVPWATGVIRAGSDKIVGRRTVQFEVDESTWNDLMAHKGERVRLIVREFVIQVDNVTAP